MPGAYWPQPWTCEDGGSRRHCCAEGVTGLGIRPGERLEVRACVEAFATDMLIRRDAGELFAMRHEIPYDGPQGRPLHTWVERLDPNTLDVIGCTPHLPGGAYWPGGMAAHANGDLYTVYGHWAHRISPALEVLASHRLPVERPHNSFVVLDGGELVMKDCDAPMGARPSTVSVLDPDTLMPAAPALTLPQPSIARLSSDGENVIVLGTTTAFRLSLDRAAGRLVIDDSWKPSYGPAPGRSYGWDPVITDEHVLWMDQGRNSTDRTMLGSGTSPDPVRLWWVRRDGAGAPRSVQISGLAHGTESNPPAWDPVGGVVVAYDAGNAVLMAWRMDGDELLPLWRRDGLAHAGHLIIYSDTRELVVQDWADRELLRRPSVRRALAPAMRTLSRSRAVRRASLSTGHDQMVVLDLDSGADLARCAVPSPSQAFLFPAPGFQRDVYYQSLTTIARIAVSGTAAVDGGARG